MKREEVLASLTPEFRDKLVPYLDWLESAKGIVMVPYFGIRTPEEQASFWRQSRSAAAVKNAVAMLREHKADYCADLLEHGKPASGPWLTNALPGASWHQWGEAVDCYWEVNGNVCWSHAMKFPPKFPVNGYDLYATFASGHGLTPLGPSIGDWPHIQLRLEGGPTKLMSWAEIDKAMRSRFEKKAAPAPAPAPAKSAPTADKPK